MKSIKVSELSGVALDWAVGKAEGLNDWLIPVNYCGKWEHGGPIIEREKIETTYQSDVKWQAGKYPTIDDLHCGSTPLIAAMRCYVASRLGNTVEISDELL